MCHTLGICQSDRTPCDDQSKVTAHLQQIWTKNSCFFDESNFRCISLQPRNSTRKICVAGAKAAQEYKNTQNPALTHVLEFQAVCLAVANLTKGFSLV